MRLTSSMHTQSLVEIGGRTATGDEKQWCFVCMYVCMFVRLSRWNAGCPGKRSGRSARIMSPFVCKFRCGSYCLYTKKRVLQLSVESLDITTSGFWKETAATLKLCFRFRLWPFHCHRHVVFHRRTKFYRNQIIRDRVMTPQRFSRWRPSAVLSLVYSNGSPPYDVQLVVSASAAFKPAAPAFAGRPQTLQGAASIHKFWRTFKWILNCLIMCHSHTRPKCTVLSQKQINNLTCVPHQKFWVRPRGRKKDLAEGP